MNGDKNRRRHILDINPEQADLFEPFSSLYQKVRQDFCYRLSKATGTDIARVLLEREDLKLGQAVDRMINNTVHATVPNGDVLKEYISADGRLIEPHPDQEWVAGRKPEGPLECAYMNLFCWAYSGLHEFWESRLEGPLTVMVTVRRDGIEVQGVLPKPLAEAFYGEEEAVQSALDAQYETQPHDLSDDLSERRPPQRSHEAIDPPF